MEVWYRGYTGREAQLTKNQENSQAQRTFAYEEQIALSLSDLMRDLGPIFDIFDTGNRPSVARPRGL
jgi:hypothetical protein